MLVWVVSAWAKDRHVECDSPKFECTLPGLLWPQIREGPRVSKLPGQGSKAAYSKASRFAIALIHDRGRV
jgi:hypothetical protein